jgi:hypothetical protein
MGAWVRGRSFGHEVRGSKYEGEAVLRGGEGAHGRVGEAILDRRCFSPSPWSSPSRERKNKEVDHYRLAMINH